MTLIAYIDGTIGPKNMEIIDLANRIVAEYQRNNIELTLRALYYRFVARHPLVLDPSGEKPNTQANYKRLGEIINRGRYLGLVSWEAITDITRELATLNHWTSPASILAAVRAQYREDLWRDMPVVYEQWIEKDAGVGTIKGVCEANDVPYFSARGNCSSSEMWVAGQRILDRLNRGVRTVVGYGGDHDPKGVDMTRDIQERLSRFVGEEVEVRRLFLNMDQVELYNPPPNPLKEGDSTKNKYRDLYGDEAWELDALDPLVIRDLIQEAIDDVRGMDPDTWDRNVARMAKQKAKLAEMIDAFEDPDDALDPDEDDDAGADE